MLPLLGALGESANALESSAALSRLSDFELVHESQHSQVWRAYSTTDGTRFALKIAPNVGNGSPRALHLHNEFLVGQRLDHPNVIKYIALEQLNNLPVLIMKYVDGCPMHALLSNDSHFSVDRFLLFAIQLTEAVEHLHAHQVIHKQINPNNVMIERERAVLADLGAASRLRSEQTSTFAIDMHDAHLSYIAPEQTGRMNRLVDDRVDLYALGATFFHMLTGAPPFQGQDALELVYCHIAKQPAPVDQINSDAPKAIVEIVDRLLRKNAEDRYQSAKGLLADLVRCRDTLTQCGKVSEFQVAQRDAPGRLRVPANLYGRSADRTRLIKAFTQTVDGPTQLVLVSGPSGIGKTALVNEIHRPVVQSKGAFVRGKFDQLNRSTPFSAVANAFSALIESVLCEPDSVIETARIRLLEKLASEGRVLLEVLPGLERLIGPQPEVHPLAGTQAERRFLRVFTNFVATVCTAERPLVIFIDDLQWADTASLVLAEKLLSEVKYLLVIGAYRSNEVQAGHPVLDVIARITESGVPVTRLQLSELKLGEVTSLVCDALRMRDAAAHPLAALLHQRSGGNPFFITQILGKLFDEEHVRPGDSVNAPARFDMTQIESLTLTDDVIEFMTQRLAEMPDATRDALRFAACVGNAFNLSDLTAVLEMPYAKLARALWPALQAGMLLPLDETYKIYLDRAATRIDNIKIASRYRFLHDRVQQGAYALIPESKKAETHFRIGSRWWHHLGDDTDNKLVFETASHLNRGRAFFETTPSGATWRGRLRELNLRAGLRATNASAHEAAFSFLQSGLSCISDEDWDANHETTYELHYHAAESAVLTTRFDEAESLYAIANPRVRTPLEEARMVRLQATHYQLQGRNRDAIAILRDGITRAGWKVPDSAQAVDAAIHAEVATIFGFVTTRGVDALLDLPTMTDPLSTELMGMLQVLFYAGYRSGETQTGLLALCRMTTWSMEHGNCEMSPFGYVGFGLVCTARLGDYTTAYAFGKTAIELSERTGDIDARGMTNYIFASDVVGWSRPLRDAMQYYDEAYRYGFEADNLLTVGFFMQQSATEQFAFGMNLDDLVTRAEQHAHHLGRIGAIDSLNALRVGAIAPARNLMEGDSTATALLDHADFSEHDFLTSYAQKPYYLAWYFQSQMRLRVIWQHEEHYPDLLAQLNVVLEKVPSHANKLPASVSHCALMHLALARKSQGEQRQSHLEEADKLCDRLQVWRNACPDNVAHKWQLVMAETKRTLGLHGEALDHYQHAVKGARDSLYLNEEALANELAGRFLLEWDKSDLAAVYLNAAYDCYVRWGARAKANALSALTGKPDSVARAVDEVRENDTPRNATEAGGPPPAADPQRFDVLSMIKVADSLAGIVDEHSLFARLAALLGENSGAETCALLQVENEQWTLRSLAQVEPTTLGQGGAPRTLSAQDALPQGLINYVRRTLEPVIYDHENATQEHLLDDTYVQRVQPRSVLAMPIRCQGELMGVAYLENRLTGGVFTHERMPVMEFLCAQAGIALKNARLYSELQLHSETLEQQVAARTADLKEANLELATLAATDSLTGVPNRRSFEATLSEQWSAAQRTGRWVALISVDVDFFKAFNDHYGHPAGDACLRSVASAMRDSVRGNADLVARLGGEEFGVVLPGANLRQAAATAERLIATVERLCIPHATSSVSDYVTISIGVAGMQPGPGDDPSELMRRGDAALYRAKETGRNRSVVFEVR